MVTLSSTKIDALLTAGLLSQAGVDDAKYNCPNPDAITVISPVNGVAVARVCQSTQDEIVDSIARSKAVFAPFSETPPKARARLAEMITTSIIEKQDLFKTLLVIEAGKCIAESGDDINKVKKDMEWSIDQVVNHHIFEPRIEVKDDGTSLAFFRKGIGPVGVIGPFNYPMGLPFESITPALLAGNPVILKPSELTPLSALLLEVVVKEVLTLWNSELTSSYMLNDPEAVFQLVVGGQGVGQALTSSKDIPVITAVTSTETGEKIRPVIEGRGGKFVAEQGGNAAVVVTEFGDAQKAVDITVLGLFKYCGQRCSTPRRMIAVGGKWKEMLQLLRQVFTQDNIAGDPFDTNTKMGPLINESAYTKMQDELKEARDAGAEIIGGERLSISSGGFYVAPALVIVNKNTDAVRIETIMSKETFAPIMYARQANDFPHAIAITNQGKQHLTCGIFTDNDDEYAQFVFSTKAGVITKNRNTSGPGLEGPYGGPEGTGDSYRGGVESWKVNFRSNGFRTIICNSHAELNAFLERLGCSSDGRA